MPPFPAKGAEVDTWLPFVSIGVTCFGCGDWDHQHDWPGATLWHSCSLSPKWGRGRLYVGRKGLLTLPGKFQMKCDPSSTALQRTGRWLRVEPHPQETPSWILRTRLRKRQGVGSTAQGRHLRSAVWPNTTVKAERGRKPLSLLKRCHWPCARSCVPSREDPVKRWRCPSGWGCQLPLWHFSSTHQHLLSTYCMPGADTVIHKNLSFCRPPPTQQLKYWLKFPFNSCN